MEVFQLEKKVLTYCAIERFPSRRMKDVFYRLKILNFTVVTFCILTSIFYIITTKGILDIAESMASGTTALIMLIKYAVFNRRAEETFRIMDEIIELNKKCELLFNRSITFFPTSDVTPLSYFYD